MEKYTSKGNGYELFGARMTIDTEKDMSFVYGTVCNSCQCNCQQCFACRNMRTDKEGDNPFEAEKALENLLDEAA